MIIEYKNDLNRADMAQLASNCMGYNLRDFKPYKPNEHDDSFWTIDNGNDWEVKFFDENKKQMEIVHRYRDETGINAFAEWIAYRSKGNIIKR